jgi:hypothetical protein
MLELVLLIANIVSWGAYFKTDDRRKAAEFFARELVQNKELREQVVNGYEEFKKAKGA